MTEPAVALSLIDGFVVSAEDRRLEMSSAKARAMFAHIALSPNMDQSRERLAGLLWGDSTERWARASLRGALLAFRETLGQFAEQVLATSNQSITLLREGLQVDILEIGNLLRAGEVPAPLLNHQNICDGILANVFVDDDAFGEWLTVYRQTMQENWMRSLRDILRNGVKGDLRADAAYAIRNLDPLHEEASRYLMEHLASQGDVAGALKVYNHLYEGLGKEYDMEPAEETQALVERVKLGLIPKGAPDAGHSEQTTLAPLIARAAANRSALTPKPAVVPGSLESQKRPLVTIMVSDFVAEMVGSTQRYLVTGFKDDLITGLVRFRDWVIMGNSPSLAGPSFGANDPFYHLNASALEEPEGVRLSLFIQHGVTGQFVWTERFFLSLEEWAQRQRMVVRRLAMALNVHLSSERVRSLAAADEFSAGVQDQWLRG